LSSFLRRSSPNLILDDVQSSNPFQSFPGQRQGVGLFQVIELAANVGLILSTR